MAQSDVQRLSVVISARDKEFKNTMNRVMRQMNKVERNVRYNQRKMNKSFAKMGKGFKMLNPIVAGLTAALSIRSFGAKASQMVEYLDDIGKQADALGISTRRLQEYRAAAEGAGVSVQQFDKGYRRFAQAISDADSGLATTKRAFKALGVDIHDTEGNLRDMHEVLMDVADGIGVVGSEAKLQGSLRDLFGGRQGARFKVFLEGGRKSVEGMMSAVRAAGAVVDDHIVRKAERIQTAYDLNMRIVKANMSNTGIEIKEIWSSMLVVMSDGWRKFTDSVRDDSEKMTVTLSEELANLNAELEELDKKQKSIEQNAHIQITIPDSSGIDEINQLLQMHDNHELIAIDEERTRLLERQAMLTLEIQAREEDIASAKESQRIAELNLKIDERLEQLKFEESLIGKTKEQVQILNELRKLGLTTEDEISKRLIEQIQRLNQLKAAKDADAEADRRRIANARDALNARANAQSALTKQRAEARKEAEKYLENTLTAQEMLTRELSKVDGMYEAGTISAKEHYKVAGHLVKEYVDTLKAAEPEIVDSMASMRTSLESNFESTFANIHNIIADGSDGIKGAVRSMVNAVLTEFNRLVFAKPLANMLAGAVSGMFGGFGGFGGASVSGPSWTTNGTPMPFRASGGPVSRGSPYVVGERGPEVFVPGRSGRILNGSQSMRGGGDVTINQNLNFSVGVQETVKNEIYGMLPQIADITRASVQDAQRRGIS